MSRENQGSSKPSDYYVQARPEMLAFIPSSAVKILEVGCGEGHFGAALKKQKAAREVWGVELVETAAARASQKLDKVLSGDILKLVDELPAECFDCIVMNDVIEHLADPGIVVSRLRKTLSPNGVVVCSIPNVRYFFVLLDLIVRKQWKYEDAGVLDRTHLRFFTEKSIIDFFSDSGFEVEAMQGIHGISSWKFDIINYFSLGWLSDAKYPQFACVARPRRDARTAHEK